MVFGLWWPCRITLAQGIGPIHFRQTNDENLQGIAEKHVVCQYDFAVFDPQRSSDTVLVSTPKAQNQWHVGSLGKIVVAMGILKLAEQGRLQLEDPVAKHLPDLELANPWEVTDPVRIVHLLEHSAGLDDMHFQAYFLGDRGRTSLSDALARDPASRHVRWRPGTRSAYSNVGYAIAAGIIEVVTQQEADRWLQASILDPMGMERSFFDRGDADLQGVVPGCRGKASVPWHSYLYYPAVGFVTSVEDMGRLVTVLLGKGQCGGDTILKSASVARMMRSETTLASIRGWQDGDFGLGFRIWGDESSKKVSATGFVDGYLAAMELYPAHNSGWVLLSTDVNDRGGYMEEMRKSLNPSIHKLESPIVLPKRANSPVPGHYRFANSRNSILDFQDYLFASMTVSMHLKGRDTVWLGKIANGQSFVIQTVAAESDTSLPHFNACVGKTSEGRDFLVIEGKYFERTQQSSVGLLWLWKSYRILVFLCTGMIPVFWWFRKRRWQWLKDHFQLAWIAVLPYWLGNWGYSLVLSENYWDLSRVSFFSVGLALMSILIPLTSLISVVGVFWKKPKANGWMVRIAFIPLVLGNIGLNIYLICFGLLPFFSWLY
jgi:CubicO group peptidase (beta-lactamase class C family)